LQTREGTLDLEDEIGVVAETVGLALDDLDLVVDPFQPTGVDGKASG
jgi:hypothetical protein